MSGSGLEGKKKPLHIKKNPKGLYMASKKEISLGQLCVTEAFSRFIFLDIFLKHMQYLEIFFFSKTARLMLLYPPHLSGCLETTLGALSFPRYF